MLQPDDVERTLINKEVEQSRRNRERIQHYRQTQTALQAFTAEDITEISVFQQSSEATLIQTNIQSAAHQINSFLTPEHQKLNYFKNHCVAILNSFYEAHLACEAIFGEQDFPSKVKEKFLNFLKTQEDWIMDAHTKLCEQGIQPILYEFEDYFRELAKRCQNEHRLISHQDYVASPYADLADHIQAAFINIITRIEQTCKFVPYAENITAHNVLDWKIHSYRLQQQALISEPHDEFDALLKSIGQLAHCEGVSRRCYICYAWPLENHPQEYWIQDFLLNLANQLEQAAVTVFLDIKQETSARDLFKHMDRIKECDTILLIGTESLLDKHTTGVHPIQYELNLIQQTQQIAESKANHRIIPLCFTDAPAASFPANYPNYLTSPVLSLAALSEGYLGLIKFLLQSIYSFEHHDEYSALWQAVEAEHPQWFRPMAAEDVQAFLTGEAIPAITQLQPQPEVTAPPFPFQLPLRNKDFTGRNAALTQMAQQLQSNQYSVITQNVLAQSVTGIGGVGKTQLANEYANAALDKQIIADRQLNYYYIVWLYVENDLSGQLYDLATKHLGIRIDQGIKTPELVRLIYRELSQYQSLVVFDNAESKNEITDYLPPTHLAGNIHVLVTSRNQHWEGFQCIELNNFTPEEALEYIQKRLPNATEKLATELAKTLHNFPLALAQATAYIQQQRDLTIESYLKLYSDNKKSALELRAIAEDEYKQSVYTTWWISMRQIQAVSLAPETLFICAYLAAEGIPKLLVQTALQTDANSLNEAISCLRDYSLFSMNRDKKSWGMHQLLQEVIQLQLEAQLILSQIQTPNTIEESEPPTATLPVPLRCIKQASNGIKKIYPWNKPKMENYTFAQKLIPHGESLLKHYDFYLRETTEQSLIVSSMLAILADAYDAIGNTDKQVELLEKELLILENIHGKKNIEVVRTLNNLGNAYNASGDSQKAKELQEQALKISENEYGPYDVRVAITLSNLANTFGSLGDAAKKRDMLERALLIDENYFGKSSVKIVKTLHNLGNAYNDLGNSHGAKKLIERALSILEKNYETDHLETATILSSLGATFDILGKPLEAITHLERALKILEKYYGIEHVKLAISLSSLANAYGALGNTSMQLALLERALILTEKHYGIAHIKVASLLNNLAIVHGSLGNMQKANELLERALVLIKTDYGIEHVDIAKILDNLGLHYVTLGKISQGRELFERALPLLENHYGSEHVEVAKIKANLSSTYNTLNDAHKMLELSTQATKILENYYGLEHIEITKALINVATAYGILDKKQEKLVLLKRVLSIQSKYYGNKHIEVAKTMANLGNAYGALDNMFEKFNLQSQALLIFENHYGAQHVGTSRILFALSNTCRILGKLMQAKEYCEKALIIWEKHYGRNHLETSKMLHEMGLIYYTLKELSQAKVYLEEALAICETHYGKDHVEIAMMINDLGAVCLALKNFPQAKTCFEKTLSIHKKHYGNNHYIAGIACDNLLKVSHEMQDWSAASLYCRQLEQIVKANPYRAETQRFNEPIRTTKQLLESFQLNQQGLGYYKAQNYTQACQCFIEVLEINHKKYKSLHLDTSTAAFNVGSCYCQLNQQQTALPYLQEALDIRVQLLGANHVSTKKAKNRLKECKRNLIQAAIFAP